MAVAKTGMRPRWRRGLGMHALVVLTVLGGLLAMAVARSAPASAYSEGRNGNEIVLTSERMSDNGVHATVILTLRSSGEIVLRGNDVHNAARTRKFVDYSANFTLVEAGFDVNIMFPTSLRDEQRIDSGETHSWETRRVEPRLQQQWASVVNGSLRGGFHFRAYRSRL
jgi:predicted small integral membrane protein